MGSPGKADEGMKETGEAQVYLIAVGDELLSADTLETNNREIQALLMDQGLRVGQCTVVGDRVEGIVTLHHVKQVPRDRWASTTVGEAMTPFDQLKKVRPDEGLFDTLQQMTAEDVNQLPVEEDGRFLGMVSRDTVLAFIQTRTELGV